MFVGMLFKLVPTFAVRWFEHHTVAAALIMALQRVCYHSFLTFSSFFYCYFAANYTNGVFIEFTLSALYEIIVQQEKHQVELTETQTSVLKALEHKGLLIIFIDKTAMLC